MDHVSDTQAEAALAVLLVYIAQQPTAPVRGDKAPPECVEVHKVRDWCCQLLMKAGDLAWTLEALRRTRCIVGYRGAWSYETCLKLFNSGKAAA
jgi:hypothetical protein